MSPVFASAGWTVTCRPRSCIFFEGGNVGGVTLRFTHAAYIKSGVDVCESSCGWLVPIKA